MASRIVRALVIGTFAALLTGAATVQSGRAATGGLVAAYGFDEGSGTVLHDASGNTNDGTISGASWATGRYGGALTFNGSSNWVTIPNSSSLATTSAVSVEAWVKPTTVASWRAVAVKEQTTQLSYGLYASSASGPAALVYAGAEKNATSASKLALNTWNHIAAVYTGSSLQMYVNGSLAASTSVSGGISQSGGALRVGGDAIWNEWFAGQIDELRVYNRALTAGEIQSDMTVPIGSASVDTAAPTAPSGLTAGTVTQTSIAVSWSASTDNVGVTGYGLYRNGTSSGSTASTSSSFTGLACGTSYSLAVDAVDAAGNRSGKSTITASTAACSVDAQAPTVPAGLTAGAKTQTSIAVSWSASTDNVGVTGYGLYRNGTSSGSTASTSSSFTGLACGTSYTLAVDAVDGAGNRSAKATLTASTTACSDTQAPSTPAGYGPGTVTQTSIPMSWSAATDNVGVTGYGVYMTGVMGASTSSLSYSYTGLTCGTNYSLAVDAVDGSGNRSAKASMIVATAACSTPPPPPPSGNANLWVDTNGGSCARQASAGGWVDASACGSFQAAYSAAQCGDTVGVRGGTYGSQSISSGSKACTSSTQVKFTSVPGATCTNNSAVTMPSFSLGVAYVRLACMNANPTGTTSCAMVGGSSGKHNSVIWNSLDNVAMHCAFFDSDHMHVTNSTFGPDNTCQTAQEDLVVFRANSTSIDDVVFDHVTFATVTAPPDFQCGSGKHVDSMQGYGVSNLVVSNSVFYGCPGQCVIFRPFAGGVPGPLTFENNVFNQPQDPGGALSLGTSSAGDACNGRVLVQNNTFATGANMNGGYTTGTNCSMVIRDNIFTGSFSCNLTGSLDSYTNNVFKSGSAACGTSGKACTPAFVGALSGPTSNGNYHLLSTDTCARGAASQTAGAYSTTDMDGQARPQGPADAGADEVS